MVVRDVISNKKYYFHANTWLAADRGDMATSLEISASSDPQPPKADSPVRSKQEDPFLAKQHAETVCNH